MNPTRSTVRHTRLTGPGKTIPNCLSIVDNMCAAGAQSAEVQGSPVALGALGVLQAAVTTAAGSLTQRLSLAQALLTAIKVLADDFGKVTIAVSTYEAAVNALANGSAAVITGAGCLAKGPKAGATALGPVTAVRFKPGKRPAEAILSWPAGPGATAYAIEVSFTTDSPTGPWTALRSGSGRRRVVRAPAPTAQFLARVASLGSDGTQSDWSDVILATAR